MNTLELLGLLNENITFFAFEQIREDLFKNYRDELKKLHFNKSTTEAATKKYIAGAGYKRIRSIMALYMRHSMRHILPYPGRA